MMYVQYEMKNHTLINKTYKNRQVFPEGKSFLTYYNLTTHIVLNEWSRRFLFEIPT